MIKKILLCLLALFFILARPTLAQEEFTTSARVRYDVAENGNTTVTYHFSLTNNFSNLYATGYTLTLTGINPTNIRATENGKRLEVESQKREQDFLIKVNFIESIVGKGNTRNFEIAFEDSTIATKTGEVWEIAVPKLANSQIFQDYQVTLTIPLAFGKEAYISPRPNSSSTSAQKLVYSFAKEDLTDRGISAAFGQFQVFSFDLTYHLENPLPKTALTEIAIPPDTAFQKVIYQKLEPLPTTVGQDADGNWIATYRLKPRERVDVKAAGAVQIYAQPRIKQSITPEQTEANTQRSDVWQTESKIVVSAARSLTTPRQIYDYVVRTLSYDYERVRPNVDRLGAEAALQNPKAAICMEFTDVFIALARARGIPAREINGYAYTENKDLQPLSLVADVLHAWPEYWDSNRSIWVPVDPTWGSTTGGEDFFSKLDLRHFTFVIHGRDPNKPFPPGSYKLGANPQKDVYVAFGQLPEERVAHPTISVRTSVFIPFTPTKVNIKINNPGPVAIDDKDIDIFFDSQKVSTQRVNTLLPFSSLETSTQIPFSLLGSKTPAKLTINYAGGTTLIPTSKLATIIASLGGVFLFIFLIALGVFLKVKGFPRKKKV